MLHTFDGPCYTKNEKYMKNVILVKDGDVCGLLYPFPSMVLLLLHNLHHVIELLIVGMVVNNCPMKKL